MERIRWKFRAIIAILKAERFVAIYDNGDQQEFTAYCSEYFCSLAANTLKKHVRSSMLSRLKQRQN